MNEKLFVEKLTAMRKEKNISGRELGLSIGLGHSYISKMERDVTYPSMSAFLAICKYFNVSPAEFFDAENKHPEKINALISASKKLDDSTLMHLVEITEELAKNK